MDFIKINYTGKLQDNTVFDTSLEEEAKKADIYDSKRLYKPLNVVVGEGQVIKGLDEELATMKVGEKKTVTIEPEKAYGQRDSQHVKLVPVKLFKQKKINPFPGMPVEIDGMHGKVQTVSGGRVRVDFNHELAGKTLVFDVEVIEKADSDQDKIKYLIERNFEGADGFDVKVSGKNADISLPKEAFHDRNLMVRKASLSAEAFRLLELDAVNFLENWVNPKKEASEAEKSKAKEEPKPEGDTKGETQTEEPKKE